jgi:peroxiredoxin
MKYLIGIVCLLLIVTENASAQVPAATIPVFQFYQLNKKSFVNKDIIQGTKRFFVFFDSDCDHCQYAISEISKHYKDFVKTTLYVLSLDKPQKMNLFIRKHGPNLIGKSNVILLQDVNDEFIKKFGPRKYPSMFLYTSKNKLLMYDDNEKKLPAFLKLIKKHD